MSQHTHILPRIRGRILALGAVLAAVSVLALAGTANAAQFSSPIPPQHYTIGNCGVSVGPVYDQWASPATNWSVIGGVSVHCTSNHAALSVGVKEVWSSGNGNWYYVGQPGSASGSYISGWNDIIHTSGVCGSGQWFTRAWISIDGTRYVRDSVPKTVTSGCHT